IAFKKTARLPRSRAGKELSAHRLCLAFTRQRRSPSRKRSAAQLSPARTRAAQSYALAGPFLLSPHEHLPYALEPRQTLLRHQGEPQRQRLERSPSQPSSQGSLPAQVSRSPSNQRTCWGRFRNKKPARYREPSNLRSRAGIKTEPGLSLASARGKGNWPVF